MQPRLGPKPFTPPNLNDTENTFSKVFSVPAVPGQTSHGANPSPPRTEEKEPEKVEKENQKSPTDEIKVDLTNNKSGSSGEEEASSDSGYVPRTPSTAERRKLFESRSDSKENEPDEGLDSIDFERGGQRASIAERRKIYENRYVFKIF